MNSRGMWRTLRLCLIAAVVLAAVVGVMTVVAQEGNEPPPKELANEDGSLVEDALPDEDEAGLEALGRVINIPVAAFTSDGADPDGYWKSFAGGYFYGTVASGACLSAPVIFPRGATQIVSVKVYARDANAGDFEWFDFYRTRLGSCSTERIGRVQTVDSACREYNMAVAPAAIANAYAYQITTCARPNIYVYGVKVIYR